MKKIKHFLIIIISIFFSFGCTKKKGCTDIVSISYDPEAEKDDGSCEYGGEGGRNTIVLYPNSQGKAVFNKPNYLDSVYIKFNAIGVPGGYEPSGGNPNLYDKIYTGVVGDTIIKITGLKKGKYYIYVTGVDSSLMFGIYRVTQGFELILNQNESLLERGVRLDILCCVF